MLQDGNLYGRVIHINIQSFITQKKYCFSDWSFIRVVESLNTSGMSRICDGNGG